MSGDILWCLWRRESGTGSKSRINQGRQRNVGECCSYPLETEAQVHHYLGEVLPAVPVVSLGGASPRPPKSYAEYRLWERQHGLGAVRSLEHVLPEGSNARELPTPLKKTSDSRRARSPTKLSAYAGAASRA